MWSLRVVLHAPVENFYFCLPIRVFVRSKTSSKLCSKKLWLCSKKLRSVKTFDPNSRSRPNKILEGDSIRTDDFLFRTFCPKPLRRFEPSTSIPTSNPSVLQQINICPFFVEKNLNYIFLLGLIPLNVIFVSSSHKHNFD